MHRPFSRILVLSSLAALALTGACKDGGGGTGTGKQPVASVVITNAPDSIMPVGSSVQLGVEIKDATGKVVDRPVSWSSTDSLVAQVSARGLVTARHAGAVTIVAESEGTTGISLFEVVVPVKTVSVAATVTAMYVGQVSVLQANTLDSLGNALGRPVAWSTSDAGKATVDATGKVTVLGTGAVVITATTEGHAGSATLTLLTRPVPEWSQAGDWGTFQGNPQHTGYVPGTLDPVVFQQKWVVSPAFGTVLNPVTTGDGKVFVTNNTYFGRQVLSVHDAASGAQVWYREFGAIHSVHPPAYDNGRVYMTSGGHGDSYLWSMASGNGDLAFRTPYANQWSRYFAPTVVNGTVFMAGGMYDGMYAFGAADGVQRWFSGTDQDDQWTPAVGNGQVYAYTGVSQPRLKVVNAADGSLAYEIPDAHFSMSTYSMNVAPVLGGAHNVLATQAGRLISFDIAAHGFGWEIPGTFSGNVSVADGVLYVFTNTRLEARRESDGGLLWSWVPPEGAPIANSVVTRNLIFVSTATRTYAVDLAAHRHTWSYAAGGSLALSREGLLLIAQSNGKLAAISLR